MWVPVGDPTKRDWMAVGVGVYPPGASQVFDCCGYQSWGDDNTLLLQYDLLLMIEGNC